MASRDGPWVRFFASDWLAGTRGMSAAETGVYVTLIATMYEHDEPIERNDARLARICGVSEVTFRRILDGLIEQGKVTLEGPKLWGRKVDVEVRNRRGRAERARSAAGTKHQQNQYHNSANAPERQSSGTPRTRTRELEPELDKEDTSLRSVAPSAPKPKPTRLSMSWVLPEDFRKWALEKGLPPDRIAIEADKMRDWSINAPKLGAKLDWFAAWRGWVRKAIDDLPRARGPTGRPLTGLALVEEELRREIENAGYREEGFDREAGEGLFGGAREVRLLGNG